MLKIAHRILAAFLLSAMFTSGLAADDGTVKVFILAGQSNMEGKAANSLLEHQATDDKTKEQFAHLRKDGKWIIRDDVFIKFLNRNGGLTIGFGSPNKTGPELEFGNAMGDHFKEPVLLIKTAWGGHSLYQKFRSPSAGMPVDETLQQELENRQTRVKKNNEKRKRNDPLPTMEDIKGQYGISWRSMLSEVKATQEDYEKMFPALKGRKLDITGFVWFQGFNDMFGDHAPGEYEANMQHFIRDVRKEFEKPNLPFVIGALGQNGSKPAKGGMVTVREAQMAMNKVEEFQGTVKAFRTDLLADKEAERLFPNWQKHIDEWKKVGSDRPYHYLGSGIWFNRIGRQMGKEMIVLLTPTDQRPSASGDGQQK